MTCQTSRKPRIKSPRFPLSRELHSLLIPIDFVQLREDCNWILLVNGCQIIPNQECMIKVMIWITLNDENHEKIWSETKQLTLRTHIFVLILRAADTNPTKSLFLYPSIAKGVYLSKDVCGKVPLSHRRWQHQCSSQPVPPNGAPLLGTSEMLQYLSFCNHLTTRNVMHCYIPVSLHITLIKA